MPVPYSSTLTWATEEGIQAYGVYTWTGASKPSDLEVYEFARDICATIVMRTEAEGARQEPPYSGTDTIGLGRILKKANEIGAAYVARMAMATLNGDERSLRVAEHLASLWKGIMGADAVEGTCLCAGKNGAGELAMTIGSASNARLLQADVTMGLVSLASNDSIEVDYPFVSSRVD